MVREIMSEEDSLVVLWTSGDKEVALNMVFMYTLNSKLNDWWSDVRMIIWGPSSKLLSEDKELQEKVQEMQDAGILVEACRSCAENYRVVEDLEDLGIDVYYIGERFSEYMKEGRKVLSL